MVVGVGAAKYQLRVGGFEGVGTAQQIDLAGMQRGNRLGAIGKAPDLDRNAEQLTDQSGVIGSQTFIVTAADIDIERRVVGIGGAEQQVMLVLEPVSVFGRQRQHRAADRARQELARLTDINGKGEECLQA
ncbi:hypothetical protein D3C78_745430 [compost metagenome]